jgi:hypothetical protein
VVLGALEEGERRVAAGKVRVDTPPGTGSGCCG